MANRTFLRAEARKLYDDFKRRWRGEKNKLGMHGKPGYRAPTFNVWYKMHQRDLEMMKESTPKDVQEYLGDDPWGESPQAAPSEPKVEEERGVVTIPIMGDDE